MLSLLSSFYNQLSFVKFSAETLMIFEILYPLLNELFRLPAAQLSGHQTIRQAAYQKQNTE